MSKRRAAAKRGANTKAVQREIAKRRLEEAAPTMAQTLIEELDAIRVWLGAETNADITDGMFASIAKITNALEQAGVKF